MSTLGKSVQIRHHVNANIGHQGGCHHTSSVALKMFGAENVQHGNGSKCEAVFASFGIHLLNCVPFGIVLVKEN